MPTNTVDPPELAALNRAIENAGSMTALAKALGIKPPSISEWKQNKRVSHKRVLDIEALTGVPRHELRPDIYPPEKAA